MSDSIIFLKVLFMMIPVLVNYGCEHEEDILITYDLIGNWKVVAFEDHSSSTRIIRTNDNTWTNFNNGDITVSFTTSGAPQGIVSGRNVTNTFSGDFVVDEGGGISISNMVWTKINEPEWARLFHVILEAGSYEVRNGQLVVFCSQRKYGITLERN